jgi:hypothetical protein
MRKPCFTWDEEFLVATCELSDGNNHFCGLATCHDDDEDMASEKTGSEIALKRAKISYFRHYRDCLKERLAALRQLYYSMNQSQKFNEASYENKMLQRQIRLLETDLETARELLNSEQESLREYIAEKDKFYKKVRANREGKDK